MKNLLSYEIGRKYEKTVTLYQNKGDEKPLLATTVSGDYRISVRRLLFAAAIAAGIALFAVVSAELDRPKEKK